MYDLPPTTKKELLLISVILVISFIYSVSLNISKNIPAIISGVVSGVVTGVILYLVFNYIIIKRPKVRLYVEDSKPKLNEDQQFLLRFYLNNTGNTCAKDIQLTVDFHNLEVVRNEGKFIPLDRHRGNKPSIQFNNPKTLYNYPTLTNCYIGEVSFRVKNLSEETFIVYDVVGEDMEYFKDIIKIKPQE